MSSHRNGDDSSPSRNVTSPSRLLLLGGAKHNQRRSGREAESHRQLSEALRNISPQYGDLQVEQVHNDILRDNLTTAAVQPIRLAQRLRTQAHDENFHWDFAVHLSTSGAPDESIRIARSIPGLLEEVGIEKLIYVSSMAVMGPSHVTSRPAVSSRLQCEAYYKSVAHHKKLEVTIVRPSAIGPPAQGIWRQSCLFLLRWLPEAAPRCLRHCNVEPERLAQAIIKVGLAETRGMPVHCIMGPVHPLVVTRPPTGIGGWVLEVSFYVWCRLSLAILFHCLERVFLWVQDWMVCPVHPCSEEDIMALCSPHSLYHTQIAGGGSMLRLHRKHAPGKLVVSTRQFKGIVRRTESTVCVRSGTTLGELATLLGGPWGSVILHPSCSLASAGGVVAVPVHGSGPKRRLVSDCVKSVTYLHRGQVFSACTEEAQHQGFDLILLVDFYIDKLWKTVCIHERRVRCLPSRLSCAGVVTALDTDQDANVELALLLPQIRNQWKLCSYAASSRSRILTDSRGTQRPILQWLLVRAATVLSQLGVYDLLSSALATFEVFMEEYDFVQFINELSAIGARCPLIRILIRRCCSPAFFGHNRPMYAIDATSLQLETYLAACRSLFSKYSSARLHPSKYIGSLAPAVAVLSRPICRQQ